MIDKARSDWNDTESDRLEKAIRANLNDDGEGNEAVDEDEATFEAEG